MASWKPRGPSGLKREWEVGVHPPDATSDEWQVMVCDADAGPWDVYASPSLNQAVKRLGALVAAERQRPRVLLADAGALKLLPKLLPPGTYVAREEHLPALDQMERDLVSGAQAPPAPGIPASEAPAWQPLLAALDQLRPPGEAWMHVQVERPGSPLRALIYGTNELDDPSLSVTLVDDAGVAGATLALDLPPLGALAAHEDARAAALGLTLPASKRLLQLQAGGDGGHLRAATSAERAELLDVLQALFAGLAGQPFPAGELVVAPTELAPARLAFTPLPAPPPPADFDHSVDWNPDDEETPPCINLDTTDSAVATRLQGQLDATDFVEYQLCEHCAWQHVIAVAGEEEVLELTALPPEFNAVHPEIQVRLRLDGAEVASWTLPAFGPNDDIGDEELENDEPDDEADGGAFADEPEDDDPEPVAPAPGPARTPSKVRGAVGRRSGG